MDTVKLLLLSVAFWLIVSNRCLLDLHLHFAPKQQQQQQQNTDICCITYIISVISRDFEDTPADRSILVDSCLIALLLELGSVDVTKDRNGYRGDGPLVWLGTVIYGNT